MKKIIPAFLICSMCLGCAQGKTVNPNYQAYVNACNQQAQQETQPLLDLQLHENGTIKSIQVSLQGQNNPNIQPYKESPNPAWGLLQTTLSVAAPVLGSVWSIHESGKAFANVLKAGQGSSSSVITNSYNQETETTTGFNKTADINRSTNDSFNPVDNSQQNPVSNVDESTNESFNPVDNSQQNPVSNVDESINDSQNPDYETPVYLIEH